MSNPIENGPENEEVVEDLPKSMDHEKEWAIKALAIMPLKSAVDGFIESFPHYKDEKYGSLKKIHEKLTARLKTYLYDKRRPHRELIQDHKEKLKLQSDLISYLPDLSVEVYIEMYRAYRYADLKPMERIRLGTQILKLRQQLEGKDTTKVQEQVTWSGSNAEFEKKEE